MPFGFDYIGSVAAASAPLRLLVFDCICVGCGSFLGLSNVWSVGGFVYAGLGRIDAARGVSSWAEALEWVVEHAQATGRPLEEVQYWGHGRRGGALIANDVLDLASLRGTHLERVRALRACFASESRGWWFRTCETVGGTAGHAFARAWSDLLDQRVAGHTHVIGFWQSGLHTVRPGEAPSWSVTEGLRDAHDETEVALGSSPLRPHTIHCLQGTIPRGW